MRSLSLVVVMCSLVVAGCLEEPDVGAPLREACVNEDSDPDTDVSFSADIFAPMFSSTTTGCLACHAPTAPTPLGFEISGLDLSSLDTLRSGGQNSGTDIVVPGQPCDSFLLLKVTDGVPFGARMPLDGPPLAPGQIQQIHDWIAEGALAN